MNSNENKELEYKKLINKVKYLYYKLNNIYIFLLNY